MRSLLPRHLARAATVALECGSSTAQPFGLAALQRQQQPSFAAELSTSVYGAPAPRAHQLQLSPAATSLLPGQPSTSGRQFLTAAGSSKKFSQRRLLGWSPEQLYTVVSTVDDYHAFVPWCRRSQVLKRSPSYMEAELEVGFQFITERYTSKVQLEAPRLVRSSCHNSLLFHHLDSSWSIERGPGPNSCWLTFSVDFAFKSALYDNLAEVFLSEVAKRMMGAFEGRCAQLYGPSSLVRLHSSPAATSSSSSAGGGAGAGGSGGLHGQSHAHGHHHRHRHHHSHLQGDPKPAAAGVGAAAPQGPGSGPAPGARQHGAAAVPAAPGRGSAGGAADGSF